MFSNKDNSSERNSNFNNETFGIMHIFITFICYLRWLEICNPKDKRLSEYLNSKLHLNRQKLDSVVCSDTVRDPSIVC